MNPLFTIGHSTHSIFRFVELLHQHEVEAVADVRSRPYSRFPWFCGPELKKLLKEHGIKYVFLGDELGARRVERKCYMGFRADYDLIAQLQLFRMGIARVKEGASLYRVALMCAERDPLDCHRTVLVCRYAKEFAEIFHILPDGNLESHEDAENRMMRRYTAAEGDLFRSRIEQLNDAYRRRGLEINYIEDSSQATVISEDTIDYED